MERIKPLARSTARPGADGSLGGFGGFFDLAGAGYRDPLLVLATDGVGTKLRVANAVGRHDTIGVDLVAMCVNDLVVQGAEPLAFLDYFATGKLDIETAAAVVEGIARGCRAAGCALVGGETAEMPGMYAVGDYDLAGFAVGAVERGRQLTASTVRAGDVVIGIASDGIHSNGYSLVRRVVEDAGLDYGSEVDLPGSGKVNLGEALLAPTRIYVSSCIAAIAAGGVKALAHITGGGLVDNPPRVLPDDLGIVFDLSAWELPPIFRWLSRTGSIPRAEMLRTFNCGIGMIAVTSPDDAERIERVFADSGERTFRIGTVAPPAEGEPRIAFERPDAWLGV